MAESIKITSLFPVSGMKLYNAWLSTREHSAFTGSGARINKRIGDKFTAWDGYITGRNLELKPYEKIIQSWRTTEFGKNDPDSRLEILFEDRKGKTKMTIIHTNIPDGQGEGYRKGWKDFYFKPMKKYFG